MKKVLSAKSEDEALIDDISFKMMGIRLRDHDFQFDLFKSIKNLSLLSLLILILLNNYIKLLQKISILIDIRLAPSPQVNELMRQIIAQEFYLLQSDLLVQQYTLETDLIRALKTLD